MLHLQIVQSLDLFNQVLKPIMYYRTYAAPSLARFPNLANTRTM